MNVFHNFYYLIIFLFFTLRQYSLVFIVLLLNKYLLYAMFLGSTTRRIANLGRGDRYAQLYRRRSRRRHVACDHRCQRAVAIPVWLLPERVGLDLRLPTELSTNGPSPMASDRDLFSTIRT
jgi:hypothetical protein